VVFFENFKRTDFKRILLFVNVLLSLSSFVHPVSIAALTSGNDGRGEDRLGGGWIPGFRTSPHLDEQELTFLYRPDVRIHINAPSENAFDPTKRVGIVLYALPNGNTIEQTAGKRMAPGDDWHFDIQHIAAQTRFLRERTDTHNLVVAYLETSQKSWPAWKQAHPDHAGLIIALVDLLRQFFEPWDPFLVLGGHSGGGSFIFGYLDACETIPAEVERISFLDSNYGYLSDHGANIAAWLRASGRNHLSVIAYNDSVALYRGKPVVSPTGGTWYRSRMMLADLQDHFPFTAHAGEGFTTHAALQGRVQITLIDNPEQAILHTVLVERNGFIQAMLSGTGLEGRDYCFWGPRAYGEWVLGEMPGFRPLSIPPRPDDAPLGSEFMESITGLDFAERERRVEQQILGGNIPGFLRRPIEITSVFADEPGGEHTVRYQVLPDYLAVGDDADFCRVPLGPRTAQRIADRFGACLPTRALVDDIYRQATVKIEPVTYYPVGDANERVEQFSRHNEDVEKRRREQEGELGQLTAGLKKDVVLSNKIADPDRTHHVVIYGWHTLGDEPIQPLTNVHIDTYVDYSHGIRLLNSEIMVDGVPMEMDEVLRDSVLYRLVSDEDGIMVRTRYETPAEPEQ
jgi:hypothetical protein